ncbi:hypothetical protein J1N35_041416, partial [Gossypium stocksii]
ISQVKKFKVRILKLNYETFKMKPEEDIKAMSNQFTIVVNGLKSYAEVTTVEEAKNLETLTLNKLISSLVTHEIRLNKRAEEEKVVKKKIGVAIKSSIMKIINQAKEVDEDK